MDLITEQWLWVLFGLLFVTAIFVITFALRNQRAKTEQKTGLHSETKQAGATPIKRTDKL